MRTKLMGMTAIAVAVALPAWAMDVQVSGYVESGASYADTASERAPSLSSLCLDPFAGEVIEAASCGILPVLASPFPSLVIDESNAEYDLYTEGELNFRAAASTKAGLVYEGVINFDFEANENDTTFEIDESYVSVTTSIGRFTGGVSNTSAMAADRIAAGHGGVSTNVLSHEFNDQFKAPEVSYGAKIGDLSFGASWNGKTDGRESYSGILYYGNQDYDVFVRASAMHDIHDNLAGSVVGHQVGGKYRFGDTTAAFSYSNVTGTDYLFTNLSGATLLPGTEDFDDVNRRAVNLAVRHDMGALAVSADVDMGWVEAPFIYQNGERIIANAAVCSGLNALGLCEPSEHKYNAFGIGAEYQLADGLTFKAGGRYYNEVLNLDLDEARVGLLNAPIGAYSSGFKMRDGWEAEVSLKVDF